MMATPINQLQTLRHLLIQVKPPAELSTIGKITSMAANFTCEVTELKKWAMLGVVALLPTGNMLCLWGPMRQPSSGISWQIIIDRVVCQATKIAHRRESDHRPGRRRL